MKFFSFSILTFFLCLLSCKEASERRSDISEDEKILTGDQLPDLSIYHLPAEWNTQNGDRIELRELEGKVLVMVMIYTSCKAACPRLVADMRGIEAQIPEEFSENIQYVLVSIDPKTDTPERLKKFSIENQMDNDQWLFFQGTVESVREFAAVLAVSYKKISPIDFSHSNIISVFDDKGVLAHQQEGLGVNNKETVEAIINLSENITYHIEN